MYSIDLDGAQLLLGYTDVFSSEIPNLKEEIEKLNMHKAISIISELIRIRDAKLDPIQVFGKEIKIPFETVLKKRICEIDMGEPGEFFSNSMLNKNVHIISVQMLLLLLKKVILHGNHKTIECSEYEISWDDYEKIIQLQLIVAEDINQKHAQEINADHFLYSTYHLNYERNVANEILRMYYIMEKLSVNKNLFEVDVQKEYRDYYKAFIDKYGFSPKQYISSLFFELDNYYAGINGLTYAPIWKSSESIYGHLKAKQDIVEVIGTLSQTTEHHIKWVSESENQEWDFSGFFEFPFITDQKGNHLSICDMTLRNAFFEKIFWLIRDCYPKTDSRAMAFFGRLFEKYIQDVTRDAINGYYNFIEEFSYKEKKKSKKSSDAYIRKGKDW